MRIVIHTQYYPPEMGAPQARLSELAQFLKVQGNEVYILTALPNYPTGQIYPGYSGFFREEKVDGIPVLRSWIYPTKSVGIFRRLLHYFSFVFSSFVIGLRRLPSKIDIVMTESPPLFLGVSGWLLSRFKRSKWLFNISDLWPDSAVQLGVIGDGVALKLSKKLEMFLYRRAALISGQSREIIATIGNKSPQSKVVWFSNGVDISKFSPTRKKSASILAEKSEHEVVFGYVGLMGIAQGLDQIIDAVAGLKGKLDRSVKFIFVGDGPVKESLQKSSAGIDFVHFYGKKSREQVPAILNEMDVAIVPLKRYIRGAVPSKLYEAMASGKPILLIADGEPATIVTEAKCGVVVQPGDLVGIQNAIILLSNDRQLRNRLGQNGREFVEKFFDRKKILEGFYQELQNLVSHS